MNEQEYNQYLMLESKEELKTKFKSYVLQFVLANTPTVEQTREYAFKMAQKMFKTNDNTILNSFVDYARSLQHYYYDNISIDYVIFEYLQKQDNLKGQIKNGV